MPRHLLSSPAAKASTALLICRQIQLNKLQIATCCHRRHMSPSKSCVGIIIHCCHSIPPQLLLVVVFVDRPDQIIVRRIDRCLCVSRRINDEKGRCILHQIQYMICKHDKQFGPTKLHLPQSCQTSYNLSN